MSRLMAFLKNEEGVSAIEYGLIAALMAVALVTAVGAITGGISQAFNTIKGQLTGQPSS